MLGRGRPAKKVKSQLGTAGRMFLLGSGSTIGVVGLVETAESIKKKENLSFSEKEREELGIAAAIVGAIAAVAGLLGHRRAAKM